MDAHQFFLGNGYKPIRKMFSQVFLGREGKPPDIIQRLDLVRRYSLGFEGFGISRRLGGLFEGLFQAVQLQTAQLSSGGGFDLLFPEHGELLFRFVDFSYHENVSLYKGKNGRRRRRFVKIQAGNAKGAAHKKREMGKFSGPCQSSLFIKHKGIGYFEVPTGAPGQRRALRTHEAVVIPGDEAGP